MLPVFRAKNKNNLIYDKFPYHPRTNNLKNQIHKTNHSSTSSIIVIISAPHIYTASTSAVMAISISAAAVARIRIISPAQ
jgi:hypothetical protein